MTKFVLFDLDGTLVDSHESVMFAMEQALLSLGITFSMEMFREHEVGKLVQIAEENLPTNIKRTTFKD